MNYKEMMKEFNKQAPNFLKQFGYSEEEINNCINDVSSENEIRDNIISKLKEKYSISIYREDFPVMVYFINNIDQNIFIEHDCSRWINIYKDEKYNMISFDPLEKDCFEKVSTHIDNLIKNINI